MRDPSLFISLLAPFSTPFHSNIRLTILALISFDKLPDNGRLWVFAADRDLTSAELVGISTAITEFLTGWAAHGAQVDAAFELAYSRFVLIGASDTAANPSGCSIDAMTRFIRALGEPLGVNFMSAPMVFFLENGKVEMTDRAAFRALVKAGLVNADTKVFDNTLIEVGAVRAGLWNLPARRSWHAKAFGLIEEASTALNV